jgi:hypothetical protein
MRDRTLSCVVDCFQKKNRTKEMWREESTKIVHVQSRQLLLTFRRACRGVSVSQHWYHLCRANRKAWKYRPTSKSERSDLFLHYGIPWTLRRSGDASFTPGNNKSENRPRPRCSMPRTHHSSSAQTVEKNCSFQLRNDRYRLNRHFLSSLAPTKN